MDLKKNTIKMFSIYKVHRKNKKPLKKTNKESRVLTRYTNT